MLKRMLGAALACATLSGPHAKALASTYNYPVQVTAYGAKCDGSTDDTEAIRSATYAAGAGGQVVFPNGTCVISGNRSPIYLKQITLLGVETPQWSDSPKGSNAGSFISVGTSTAAPGSNGAFFLEEGVTIRGLNFIYPYQITQNAPVSSPALFADDGNDPAANILMDNIHVIAANTFWTQQGGGGGSPTYGNIRIVNSDIYAVSTVFNWSNIAEAVSFDNDVMNPSVCGATGAQCSATLKEWTADNGVWMHVFGDTSGNEAIGFQSSNMVVASYHTGIQVDSNGHLDETLMGPTTVFDGVPDVLYVNSNGSITHTVFSGKVEFSGATGLKSYADPAFTLNRPQKPLSYNVDHNTLSLNGMTADGVGGPLLSATADSSGGDIGTITMTGVVVRGYCDGGTSDGVDVNAPNSSVIISGSMITAAAAQCGGVNVNAKNYQQGNNIFGYTPNS